MLPIYGPSNERDTVGLAADTAANPLLYIAPCKFVANDPLTYLGPYTYFTYAVMYNDLADSVGEYVRFSQAEMDPYLTARNGSPNFPRLRKSTMSMLRSCVLSAGPDAPALRQARDARRCLHPGLHRLRSPPFRTAAPCRDAASLAWGKHPMGKHPIAPARSSDLILHCDENQQRRTNGNGRQRIRSKPNESAPPHSRGG